MANGQNAGAIGTGLGAAIGTIIAPGPGTITGAQIGGALGGAVGGIMQNNSANNLQASPVDPLTTATLMDVRRRRRAFETGGAFGEAQKGINSVLATTQKNILRRSGGSVGAAISGLALSNRGAVGELGRISQQGLQIANQVASQEASLAQRIAQRRLELQLLQQTRVKAQGQEDQSTGLQNIQNLLANSAPNPNFTMPSLKNIFNQGQEISGITANDQLLTADLLSAFNKPAPTFSNFPK